MFRRNLMLHVAVFDPSKAAWKVENGNVVLRDGNPVLVDADGAERTVGLDTISRLNAENRTHRERYERAETSLKAFNGLDPSKVADAIKALDTVSKLDAKKLIDAGEVDRVREEIGNAFKEKLGEFEKENNTLKTQLNDLRLGNAFNSSKWIQDNVATPLPMFRAHFEKHIKVEDGKLVPYDAAGNKISSKKRLGEIADFDEAIEILIETSPFKNDILKAPNQRGSGNNGDGGKKAGVRYMSRADFEQLSHGERAVIAGKMRSGEVSLTD